MRVKINRKTMDEFEESWRTIVYEGEDILYDGRSILPDMVIRIENLLTEAVNEGWLIVEQEGDRENVSFP